MIRLFLLMLLSVAALAQEMPPPPARPSPLGAHSGQPFNPAQTREAVPEPPVELRPPGGQISVVQAVQTALIYQPDVLTAQANLLGSEGDVQYQRAALLPHLRLSSGYRDMIEQPGPFGLSSAISGIGTHGISLTQLVFDFNYTSQLVLQADRRRQAAAAALYRTENDVTLRVKEAYYQVEGRQRLLVVAQRDLANRTEQLRMARAMYQAGQRSPGDVVRAQTTVSRSVFDLDGARRNLELARQLLCTTMGLDPLTPVEVVESTEPRLPVYTLEELTSLAIQSRPDVLAAQRNVEASEAGLGAAERLNSPAIFARAGVGYEGPVHQIPVQTVNLQVAMDFDFYDGGQRAGATKVAQGKLDADQAELLRTLLSVRSEVSGTYIELITAERNLVAAEDAVASATEGVRIADGRYRAALGSVTDVFDAQDSLVLARIDLANTLTALDLARARMRHALARPFD